MKTKTFVQLGLFGAGALLACGTTWAAQVQINGQLDSYIESYTAGDKTVTRLSSGGGAGGSRVTLSASENIDSGMQAFVRLEMGILNDEGVSSGNSSYIFERETAVGVRGDFGSISFGRQYTPHFMSLPMNEAAGQTLGSAIGAFGVPGMVSTNGIGVNRGDGVTGARLATTRMDNSILYSTPNFAGFTASFMAAFGEQSYTDANNELVRSNSRGNFYNIAARYVRGAFTGNASLALWDNPVVRDAATGKSLHAFENVWFGSLSAAYDFGPAKLHMNFVFRESKDEMAPNLWATALGVSIPAYTGKFVVTGGYLRNTSTDNADGCSWGVRYDYPFSRSTFVYAGAFGVYNQDNAAFALAGGGSSTLPPSIASEETGLGNHVLFVGLNHRF